MYTTASAAKTQHFCEPGVKMFSHDNSSAFTSNHVYEVYMRANLDFKWIIAVLVDGHLHHTHSNYECNKSV